mgnify:CR=1 FL=1
MSGRRPPSGVQGHRRRRARNTTEASTQSDSASGGRSRTGSRPASHDDRRNATSRRIPGPSSIPDPAVSETIRTSARIMAEKRILRHACCCCGMSLGGVFGPRRWLRAASVHRRLWLCGSVKRTRVRARRLRLSTRLSGVCGVAARMGRVGVFCPALSRVSRDAPRGGLRISFREGLIS